MRFPCMLCRLALSQSQPFCWWRPRAIHLPGAEETLQRRQSLADPRVPCTLLKRQEVPLPSSGPLRAHGNQQGGSTRLTPLIPLSPCSSPKAPSPCPVGSNCNINLKSFPVSSSPRHGHVTLSPKGNLQTGCSLWGPKCSGPTNLSRLFIDQFTPIPLLCLLPILQPHPLLPQALFLLSPGFPALEASSASPSPPPSISTTLPCGFCTALLTICRDLKHLLVSY